MDAQRTPEDRSKFKLQFGAFAPKFLEQLINAGLSLKPDCGKTLQHLQLDAEAVARLRIRGHITMAMAVSAEKKIAKEIGRLIA
jgi:hypothetical protein